METEIDTNSTDIAIVPGITEEEYNKVQAMDNTKRPNLRSKKRRTFYPLRQFVKCAHCGKYMLVGPSTGRLKKRYLYFRCDNKDCPMKGKGVRANEIFNAIYAELEKLKFDQKTYEDFAKKVGNATKEKIAELKTDKRSLMGSIQHIRKEMERESDNYAKLTEKGRESMEKRYNEKLEDYENQIIDLQARIDDIDDKIIDPTKMQMSLDEFLNLANSAVDKMKAGTAVEKDELCRILFLNLIFDHEKGASFPWKEPFSMLVNRRSVNCGGDMWT